MNFIAHLAKASRKTSMSGMQLWIFATMASVATSLHEWGPGVNSTGECVYPGTCIPPANAKFSAQAFGPKPGNQVFVVIAKQTLGGNVVVSPLRAVLVPDTCLLFHTSLAMCYFAVEHQWWLLWCVEHPAERTGTRRLDFAGLCPKSQPRPGRH